MADITGDGPPNKRQKLQSPALTPTGSDSGKKQLQLTQNLVCNLWMQYKVTRCIVSSKKMVFVFVLYPRKKPASVWFQPWFLNIWLDTSFKAFFHHVMSYELTIVLNNMCIKLQLMAALHIASNWLCRKQQLIFVFQILFFPKKCLSPVDTVYNWWQDNKIWLLDIKLMKVWSCLYNRNLKILKFKWCNFIICPNQNAWNQFC